MTEKILAGKGRHFEEIPRKSWEEEVAIRSQHIPAVLDFMTRDHHRIRNLVVEEIARRERPISARGISEKLDMPHSKVSAILDDLENNLFFWFAAAAVTSPGRSRLRRKQHPTN